MPPSTITTSGTQSPLVSSALSYPQNADPTTYLPYSSPQILISSGTWRHPKPGFSLSITYAIFGGGGGGGGTDNGAPLYGGGGGGSGRITFVTASVTTDLAVTIGAAGSAGSTFPSAGGTGGSTVFNGTTAAGGTGGGFATSGPGAGGAGGFGGGGGAGDSSSVNGNAGGTGSDYWGGGGGYGLAGGASGISNVGLYAQAGSNVLYGSGFPNGATKATHGGGGGTPSLVFPWSIAYGQGGRGGSPLYTNISANLGAAGIQGAVFIWYNRP